MTPDQVTNHVMGQVTCHRPFLCLFMFVYVCLCLFTYVWSLDLFWKLYIVPMLRELTSLSFNIDDDDDVSHLLPHGCMRIWQCSLPPIVTCVTRGEHPTY